MADDQPNNFHEPPESPWSSRRWLARLSVSFLIFAAFLVWTAYRGMEAHVISGPRAAFYCLCALLSFVLFLLGTRERHRRS